MSVPAPSPSPADSAVGLLREKYTAAGEDLAAHLEGMRHTEFLTYWDYLRLDTLLTLQVPRTALPDERIFILLHQIAELQLKLCLNEFDTLCSEVPPDAVRLLSGVRRLVDYLRAMVASLDQISGQIDPAQFRRFRAALTPASGFQSAQFRRLEINSTDLLHLLAPDRREAWKSPAPFDARAMFGDLHWQFAGGGRPPPVMLQQFNARYGEELIALAGARKKTNLWQRYLGATANGAPNQGLREAMREFDEWANLHWPGVHFRAALRQLGTTTVGTGGTDWKSYLPPHLARRQFFPDLWSETERAEWGRAWVERTKAP